MQDYIMINTCKGKCISRSKEETIMKMRTIMTAVLAAGMLTASAVTASAAGIGYVNTNALMQAHPKMEKAQLDMKAAAQKASQDFEKQSAGKSDQEKQQIAADLQKSLAEKEKSTIGPIIQDIQKAIQQVRKEKGLDIVIDQASVIDGGIDITSEVGQKLAK